jgi:hypothetical protein
MPDERYAVTLSLTGRQLRLLRQAVFDYADARYQGRQRRLADGLPTNPSDLRPSPLEREAEELATLVTEATDMATSKGVVNASG